MNHKKLEEIHESLVNGQRKQMVKQIDEYGLYNFWSDYEKYLKEVEFNMEDEYYWFSNSVISYHRIKAR